MCVVQSTTMITRIEVDGFKTFRRFALDLEPFQIIAGPNSAGKSNLFDALKLLAYLAEGSLADALARGRGRIDDQFARLRDGAAKTIALAVELLLPMGVSNGESQDNSLSHTRIRYEVVIERRQLDTGGEELSVLGELLRPIQQKDDLWAVHHPEFAKFCLYGEQELFLGAGQLENLEFRRDGALASDPYNGPGAVIRDRAMGMAVFSLKKPVESTILCTHGKAFGPHVTAVQKELSGLRFPLVDLAKMRHPSERAASKVLVPDGSNLPTVLASLSAARMAHVRADLADLVPGARSLEIAQARDELWIEVEFNDGLRLPARVLSDGTLRLLGLLTLVRSSSPGAFIAHEEPENGIFPGRLRELLDRLLRVTAPGEALPVQLLLNTHSPVVLSVLRDHPRVIVFADLVRHPDGLRATRMRRVAEGEAHDRGATTVSRREIERLLDLSRPEEVE
jgi:predicted ATPase